MDEAKALVGGIGTHVFHYELLVVPNELVKALDVANFVTVNG